MFFSEDLVYSLLSKMRDDCHTDSDIWSTYSPESQGGHQPVCARGKKQR